MDLNNFPAYSVSFPTHTPKKDKPPYISPVLILQIRQAAPHFDSNTTQVPATTTKAMICTIYGDPMYFIEGTSNQNHQTKIESLHELSDPELFLSTAP